MIDLSSYPEFQNDIKQSQVTLYPLVIIDNTYYISTIKEAILTEEGGDLLTFSDQSLTISNIKENIDIKDRRFKISNVTIKLNNYKIDNSRFSDILTGSLNKEVEIYFKRILLTWKSIKICN